MSASIYYQIFRFNKNIFYYKHIAQGNDTIQRIVSQPRPATSSGARKFDDLFGSKYLTIILLFIIILI